MGHLKTTVFIQTNELRQNYAWIQKKLSEEIHKLPHQDLQVLDQGWKAPCFDAEEGAGG